MGILSEEMVRLRATAHDKEDAIRQAGELLVNGGCVNSNYIAGMLTREQTMSTYLGNGVSIPHGMLENRDDVQKTGISVLQLPEGVEWNDGEIVYLVIGIGAKSDEHMDVLMNLAEVIEDPEETERLVKTNDAALIIERLSQSPEDTEIGD